MRGSMTGSACPPYRAIVLAGGHGGCRPWAPTVFRQKRPVPPWNLSAISALSGMTEDFADRRPRTLTPEERKARDAARRADAEQAMREHEAAQKAFHDNRERLKAERLAREARAGANPGH